MVQHLFLVMRENSESSPMEMLASTSDRCSEETRFNTFGTHTHTKKTYEIVVEILQSDFYQISS